MRIIVIGQGPFGAKMVQALLNKDETVVAAYIPPDVPGAPIDPMKEIALDHRIPVYQPHDYRGNKVFDEYCALRPDLTILAFVRDIIPERLFEFPSHGAICFHPSLLPRHRGGSSISRTLIMGDTRTGVSIFWPDEGIDTGPILLQKEVEIGPDDTTGSLYFNHLFPLGVEALVESVDLIKEGTAPKIPQDESKATYEPLCDDSVAAIDWTKPSQEIHNLIRGCDSQPGAYTITPRGTIRLYQPQLKPMIVEDSPGTILATEEDGIRLAASGGTITIGKIRSEEGKKVHASEYAKKASLAVGSSLVLGEKL